MVNAIGFMLFIIIVMYTHFHCIRQLMYIFYFVLNFNYFSSHSSRKGFVQFIPEIRYKHHGFHYSSPLVSPSHSSKNTRCYLLLHITISPNRLTKRRLIPHLPFNNMFEAIVLLLNGLVINISSK